MKLISNTKFGYALLKTTVTDYEYRTIRQYYDEFLSRHLNLGMFVPCDEEGNVLNGRICDFNKYEQAKERVLFKGFEIIIGKHPTQHTLFLVSNNEVIGHKKDWEDTFDLYYETIEDLSILDLTLTENAIKQIF